jgi:hypothetical protein
MTMQDHSVWQRIETAPTDGTRVLLYFPHGLAYFDHVGKLGSVREYVFTGRYQPGMEDLETGGWIDGRFDVDVECEDDIANEESCATHWMPIPSAPGVSA